MPTCCDWSGSTAQSSCVEPGDWLADKTFAELTLRSEGALVPGIERTDPSSVGAPRGPTPVPIEGQG